MNSRGGSRPSVFKNPIAIVSAAIVSGIASIGASAQSAQVEHPINSVREICASLRACWISPEMSVPPQVTVRLSLKRNGVILGQPLISYENPHISEADRAALHEAVAAALARCTPLPISDALGGIIAGHPISCEVGRGMEAEKRSADSSTRKIGLAEFSDECFKSFWTFERREANREVP